MSRLKENAGGERSLSASGPTTSTPPLAALVEGALDAESSKPSSSYVSEINRYSTWIAVAIGLIVIPLLYAAGLIRIETVNQFGRFSCFAIVALGLDLIWGYTGILGLCQSMFFCLGAYAMGMHLAMHGPLDGEGIPRCLFVVSSDVSGFQLPFFWKPFEHLPAAIFLGLLVPGLVGFAIGILAFRSRVRGVYFAILTQAITLGAWMVFCRNEMRLCGTNGLTNFKTLANFDLSDANVKFGLYVVSMIVLVAMYLLCRFIVEARVGRTLIAIRDNESRLRFSGYIPANYKIFVFTLSAVLAGVGGMLYAPQMGIMTPTHMTVERSILMVIFVAVGGRGTLSGAILGAFAVNLVYSALTSRWPDLWPFVQGGLFIGVVLFFPNGLMGIWHRFTAKPGKNFSLPLSTITGIPEPTEAGTAGK